MSVSVVSLSNTKSLVLAWFSSWLWTSLLWLACLLGLTNLAAGQSYTPGQPQKLDFKNFAQPFLENHCFDCHSGDSAEGDLPLDELGPIDEVNADVWKSIWAQVAIREMPPREMDPPAVVDLLKLNDWIVSQLQTEMRDKGGFDTYLDPEKGNFVDHDLLFGPLPKGVTLRPTASPARLWRVTPQEHITRINELINTEPAYDPQKPGLRTRGDVVPTNHGGELKLYFGTDRIVAWHGGTVAYATAVKSVPAVLASQRDHGFENYPHLYSVNSAEATQIMSMAQDVIQYMAYGPLSIAEPYQIRDDFVPTDKKNLPNKQGGDIRGLPSSIFYSSKVVRPLTPIIDLMAQDEEQDELSEETLRESVDYLFEAVTFRPPSAEESDKYISIAKGAIDRLGTKEGAVLGLSAIFLDRDALFRPELAETGEPDSAGRVMLQDWELGLALNHALSYIKPDDTLRQAIIDGKMRTREDVRREVERMLSDDSIRKPRVLRFFRDFFDYDLGGYICKDTKSLKESGALRDREAGYYRSLFDATQSTGRLIEMILQKDKEVLKELLTTDLVVAKKSDNLLFGRRRTQAEMATNEQRRKPRRSKQSDEDKAALIAAKTELDAARQAVSELAKWMKENPKNAEKRQEFKTLSDDAKEKLDRYTLLQNEDKNRASFRMVEPANLKGPQVYARVGRKSFGNGSMEPTRFLATAPKERLGILTHPTWLVSHSDAMDNHAIRRGRWIRERLLGGGIPDVPITVDAQLPDEPENTLRKRMRVTREAYCWTCHQKMDPLGLPFEMYNHAGLYRTEELGLPVDTSGEIIDSGDPDLDGKVANALELIQKLADSERVEQVFVRHAFRFWMGRNETLNDAPVLRDAHKAYRENGGSMKALITSLLTSDAFLYRER